MPKKEQYRKTTVILLRVLLIASNLVLLTGCCPVYRSSVNWGACLALASLSPHRPAFGAWLIGIGTAAAQMTMRTIGGE